MNLWFLLFFVTAFSADFKGCRACGWWFPPDRRSRFPSHSRLYGLNALLSPHTQEDPSKRDRNSSRISRRPTGENSPGSPGAVHRRAERQGRACCPQRAVTISRSADFQSAVSPNCIRPGVGSSRHAAECNSAIRQNTILRYFRCGSTGLRTQRPARAVVSLVPRAAIQGAPFPFSAASISAQEGARQSSTDLSPTAYTVLLSADIREYQ